MHIPALQTGVVGINNGLDGLRRNATEIARATSGDGAASPRALVDLRAEQRQVEASVRVVKAADEMLGNLLDARA
ncbi:MAG TPA: hypothetical protein ENK51_03240 [Gammaproteobacteria bacterium]|nr:hypothetical protein [Gammaproteobacteria bacterium]